MIDFATIASSPSPPPGPARSAVDSPRSEPAAARPPASPPGRASVRAAQAVNGANLVEAQQSSSPTPGELTDEEQRIVRELRQIDTKVRRHEQAHRSAGGPYTSAATYDYTRGPDGNLYAVGGEVRIDVSAEGSPEATIRKMEVVIRAALAPADPSAQDRAVANQAKQTKVKAQAALRAQRLEEQRSDDSQPSLTQTGAAVQAYRDAASVLARSARTSADIALSTQA